MEDLGQVPSSQLQSGSSPNHWRHLGIEVARESSLSLSLHFKWNLKKKQKQDIQLNLNFRYTKETFFFNVSTQKALLVVHVKFSYNLASSTFSCGLIPRPLLHATWLPRLESNLTQVLRATVWLSQRKPNTCMLAVPRYPQPCISRP